MSKRDLLEIREYIIFQMDETITTTMPIKQRTENLKRLYARLREVDTKLGICTIVNERIN